MGKKNTRRHRSRCARNRVAGGGLGSGYHLGTEMLARGYAVVEPYSSCGALSRPGMMATDVTGPMAKGIPGLSGGGKRRGRKSRKGYRKGQRGGRYEAVMTGAEFEALGPRGGMMATAGRTPCEAGQGSALPSPTAITAPSYKGGAQLAPAPFLQEQTAGYTNVGSKWLDSVGAPIQLHEPVGGRMGTPACGQTGGRRGGMRGGNACDDATNAHFQAKDALTAAKDELVIAEENLAVAQEAGNENAIQNAQNDVNAAQNKVNNENNNVITKEQERKIACGENLVGNAENQENPENPENQVLGGRRKRKASRKQRKASRKQRKASRKASRKQRKNRK